MISDQSPIISHLLGHIHALAVDIGPRGSTTAAARAFAVEQGRQHALHGKDAAAQVAQGIPTRAGGRPGSPVTAIWPAIAWMLRSSAG